LVYDSVERGSDKLEGEKGKFSGEASYRVGIPGGGSKKTNPRGLFLTRMLGKLGDRGKGGEVLAGQGKDWRGEGQRFKKSFLGVVW